MTAREAWHFLEQNEQAQLVDVRTVEEWRAVGQPDIAALGRAALFVPWSFGPGRPNPNFLAQLAEAGFRADAPALFLCRSGVLSLAAALAVQQALGTEAYNVSDGFEGMGWVAEGLPIKTVLS